MWTAQGTAGKCQVDAIFNNKLLSLTQRAPGLTYTRVTGTIPAGAGATAKLQIRFTCTLYGTMGYQAWVDDITLTPI
jgi:hypothetical protein